MELHDILNHDAQFRYMLLDRMRMDCEYYLGNGNRHPKHLWAANEVDQIAYMKALWDSFPDEDKPVWLSYEKILDYEKQMGIKAILVEMDFKGFYKRFALTPEEFEKEFPDTYRTFSPIEESNSDTLRPLVHIWFAPCVVGDSSWERHFTDMLWGLSEGDLERIEKGNLDCLPYISYEEMGSLGKYLTKDPVIVLIDNYSKIEVNKRDWSMPPYNKSNYDSYGDYENACLDIGHERRSDICGEVIKLLRENEALAPDDESYFEIIDETVWDDITTCICRKMDKEPISLDNKIQAAKGSVVETKKSMERSTNER